MKKILLTLVLIQNLFAMCNSGGFLTLDLITKACYSCMLPLRIAGVTVMTGPLPDTGGSVSSPICTCPIPGLPVPRIGIPVSFFEPSRVIEVVKDSGCYPTMGFSIDLGVGSGGSTGNSVDKQHTFMQAHYYIFPLYSIIELFTDYACMETTGFDLAYITEVDPMWNDDELTALINPEALLFGNPVSQLACIADSIGAQINTPLDPLFWCKGSWGSTYPLSGNIKNGGNLVEDSASIAGNLIYKLHRELVLWGSWGQAGLCGYYPAPIWRKSAYRLQLVYPITNDVATSIGQTGMVWTPLKNPAFIGGDNFGYLLFKKRECCSF